MRRISYLLLSIHLLYCLCYAQGISGRVRTADDKPVVDAVVQPSGMIFSTKTGEDGSFSLDDARMTNFWSPRDEREVLFVVKKGYEVSVTIVQRGQSRADIVLRATTTEPPTVPPCSGEVRKGFDTEGHIVQIEFPKNFKLKKSSNFEYDSFTLTAKEASTKAVLHNWVGVYASTYPSTDTILNSKSFKVTRNDLGLDWKGQKTDGTYWRYFGGAIGMIDSFTYETSSETLAKQFDQVMATMCVRK